jgi:hypothetical protein
MESCDKKVVLPLPDAPVITVSSPGRIPFRYELKNGKYCDLMP